jgi:hypothetical protein
LICGSNRIDWFFGVLLCHSVAVFVAVWSLLCLIAVCWFPSCTVGALFASVSYLFPPWVYVVPRRSDRCGHRIRLVLIDRVRLVVPVRAHSVFLLRGPIRKMDSVLIRYAFIIYNKVLVMNIYKSSSDDSPIISSFWF